ncbi:MAG: ATP-binding protein [Terriglobia bacterium]|nr:ATP-binding protein [Terriglobia bacterium]
MAEKRKFSVHPHIIYSTILKQCGSLAKAVNEGVMNSIDAGATQVDIKIDRAKICIKDDGQGFRSRKEIEDFFEVFGFPHEEGARVYGQFGIGRGQLWSFCSTIWRTGTFRMDVDIKERGLDYDLDEDLESAQGVTIDGRFYTPLLTSEIAAFQRELADLAKYAQIPVIVNGKRVSKLPAEEKWDFDTDDAWIRLTENSSLAVYNLGVLVRHYPDYQFGCGGIVVTKPGVRLDLNTARNDILVAQCPVWKRIRKMLQTKSDERVRTKRTKMTDSELENLARRFIAGEVPYQQIKTARLITDVVGKGHTLESFARYFWKHRNVPLTMAEDGSQMGERAHQRKLAFVLSPRSLARFGVEDLEEFRTMLVDALEEFGSSFWGTDMLRDATVEGDLPTAVPMLSEGYDVLGESDLSKQERAALRTLSDMASRVSNALVREGTVSADTASRVVRLGVSDVAEAWTDGSTEIVVERHMIELMKEGVGGFVGLANLLVHELLHDSSDIGSHTHDHEFYSRYHDATCGRAGILNQVAMKGMHKWVIALHSLGLKVPRAVSMHLDQAERLERDAAQAAEVESEPEPVAA